VTDFEIVPGTPTTYDVNVTVNSVVESEVTPGLTGIASRVAAVESRTVAGVPATAGDYPLAALIAAGLGGTDGDPITCPPGEMTDVVVVGGNIVNRKYVYAEIVEDGGSPPGLGLPPAHLHIGKVIVQTTEQYGSSGPLVEVIPPDPDRRPALDFTTWFRALDTTDFGAGDSVDFDLDGATVTATFTGVMDKSEIITALLTPLSTAGASGRVCATHGPAGLSTRGIPCGQVSCAYGRAASHGVERLSGCLVVHSPGMRVSGCSAVCPCDKCQGVAPVKTQFSKGATPPPPVRNALAVSSRKPIRHWSHKVGLSVLVGAMSHRRAKALFTGVTVHESKIVAPRCAVRPTVGSTSRSR